MSKKFSLTFDVVTPDVFREFETFLRKVKDGRPVTIRVPLNSIAKEILERYKDLPFDQVKDPNLVGALTGHKEGSKAFARYRKIDEDMKRDLVSMLE